MDLRLPMFPLNSVLLPATSVPLHVFEDRYRALVRHVMSLPDPADRVFGSVAIREGYEVGNHGKQELYRVGCRLQVTQVTEHPDESFDILAVVRDRFRLDALETSGPFPVGTVTLIPDQASTVPPELVALTLSTFEDYRIKLREFRGDPVAGQLPKDPSYLAWVLATAAPMTFPDKQSLLEETDPAERLQMLAELFRAESRAMNVLPSLPATDVARTGWSPN
ncbi:MAG: LON peptidase substrate-binding domain-containing protein [Nocardioides sp.]